MMRRFRLASLLLVPALTLALVGCGGDPPKPPTPAPSGGGAGGAERSRGGSDTNPGEMPKAEKPPAK